MAHAVHVDAQGFRFGQTSVQVDANKRHVVSGGFSILPATFPGTVVPRDFDRIEIPFPERGEPTHIRAGDEPQEVLATSG